MTDEPMTSGAYAASGKPCEPDCGGFADYAAVLCPNPACAGRVQRVIERRGNLDHRSSDA